jgi:hypothetical protein
MVCRGMAERKRPGGRSNSSGSQESTGPEESSGSGTTRGTAPSAADITKLEKMEASEEAKQNEPSTVDAMGQDKRRQVVGHSYGPSKRSQIMFFVAVGAALVIIVGGWLTLVGLFDKPPTQVPHSAPWSTTPTNAQLATQQNAKPVSPLSPCGEPGNQYPVPAESPCAPPSKANDFQGNSGSK